MNLNHTVKVVGSVLLSAVMAGSMMPVTVFAQSNDENPTEKTETVYSGTGLWCTGRTGQGSGTFL